MTRRDMPSWVPLAILAGVLVLLFGPIIIGQRALFWGLPSLQFYPWRSFAFHEIGVGQIPFMNPYNGAGAPLLANYQTAVLYPPNWLYLFMDDSLAMSLLAVLHVFWAGLGMWLFTGLLGTPMLGRGISALSFALAGYHIARVGSFPTTNAVAWIPWLFWAVLLVIGKHRMLFVGLLAVVTAMMLLTGHAQTTLYTMLAAGLFALWGALRLPENASRNRRVLALVLAGVGVGLGGALTLPQLLLTGELLSESSRSGGVDFETLTNLSFNPVRIFNFFTPDFFGSPVDGSYLTPGKGVYFEDAVYIGFLPLISAFAAIVGRFQRRNIDFDPLHARRSVFLWVTLTLVGLILATGRFGPVYRLLYDYVPTFDSFREPVRWMIWPVFSLSVLAGIGVSTWGRGPRTVFWSRLWAAGGLGMVVVAVAAQQFTEATDDYVPVLSTAMITIGSWLLGACLLTLVQPDSGWRVPHVRWQVAVLLFVAADLGWAGHGLNPTVPNQFYRPAAAPEANGRIYWFEAYEEELVFETYFDLADYRKARENWRELRRTQLPNLNILDEVEVFNNFDPLVPGYHDRYVELIEAQGQASGSMLLAAGVGQVYGDVQPSGWEPLGAGPRGFRAEDEALDAWMVAGAEWAASDAEAEAMIMDADWSPAESVILLGSGDEATSNRSGAPEVSFYEVLRDSSDDKRFRIVTEDGGFLVLATSWYPGWGARVNGESAPLYRANLAFMAVEVPPGGGDITVRYLPTISPISLVISVAAFFIILTLIIVGLIRQDHIDKIPVQ